MTGLVEDLKARVDRWGIMKWIKQLFSRRRLYGELSEEIREHLEEKIEELVADGMSRKEATAAARRAFGNVGMTEEDGRRVWRWPSIEDFFMDVHFSLRVRANRTSGDVPIDGRQRLCGRSVGIL
jgi:hypothetical protein